MTSNQKSLIFILFIFSSIQCQAQRKFIQIDSIPNKIYPHLNDARPNLPSPFISNDSRVFVIVYDTKGGQKSIFNDKIQGAFQIKLWREPGADETEYLKEHYGRLSEDEFTSFISLLSRIETGEMEPQYIMRYGFYEGHTNWRTDPIAISFVFGLKSLKKLDKAFDGKLDKVLTRHFTK